MSASKHDEHKGKAAAAEPMHPARTRPPHDDADGDDAPAAAPKRLPLRTRVKAEPKIADGAELTRRLRDSGTGEAKLLVCRQVLRTHRDMGELASADDVIDALKTDGRWAGTVAKAESLRDTGEMPSKAAAGYGVVPIEDQLLAGDTEPRDLLTGLKAGEPSVLEQEGLAPRRMDDPANPPPPPGNVRAGIDPRQVESDGQKRSYMEGEVSGLPRTGPPPDRFDEIKASDGAGDAAAAAAAKTAGHETAAHTPKGAAEHKPEPAKGDKGDGKKNR